MRKNGHNCRRGGRKKKQQLPKNQSENCTKIINQSRLDKSQAGKLTEKLYNISKREAKLVKFSTKPPQKQLKKLELLKLKT